MKLTLLAAAGFVCLAASAYADDPPQAPAGDPAQAQAPAAQPAQAQAPAADPVQAQAPAAEPAQPPRTHIDTTVVGDATPDNSSAPADAVIQDNDHDAATSQTR